MNCLRNRAIFSLSSIVAATLSVVSLTGCAGFGAASFPDASANAKTPIGTIQGSNFGGHAPLTNAHIYLVESGTGGYGSVVKGLLTATSANPSFPTTKNGSWGTGPTASDNFVPATDSVGNPFYGVTTDSTGNFQISGDYTCDPGSPVYLIGYGGTPSYPSTVNTFNISSVDVVGTASPYTYTFTISNPPENAYIGESATVTGITGTTFTYLGTVLQAANLTTTTFELTSSTGTAGTHAQTGASVTFSPTFNPAPSTWLSSATARPQASPTSAAPATPPSSTST